MTTKGIDVSKWQSMSVVDNYIAQNPEVKFIVMKATEGGNYKDPTFQDKVKRYKDRGYVLGAYHFARKDLGNGAITEAENFMQSVRATGIPMFLVLDLEGNSQKDSVEWTEAWLQHVTDGLGTRPMLYCGKDYTRQIANSEDVGKRIISNYGLWLAAYINQKPVAGKNFYGWNNMTMWQYTSKPLDKDEFYGSVDQLKKFVMPTQTSETKICKECGRPL